MKDYFHSVTLDKEKCTGCTNCIKRCPTEAIRVRDGKARIINERCIDCGECIRVCPHHAKSAQTDPFDMIGNFKYKIALPAPTLYGQFKNVTDIGRILGALKALGFDDVFETSVGADVVSKHIAKLLQKGGNPKPMISSACPAILRLVQVRFPELIDNIMPVRPPVEVAAMLARENWMKKTGCSSEDIGIFFISPCPAKMTAVHNPLGVKETYIDGVISIMEVYGKMSELLQKPQEIERLPTAGISGGVGWANSGGEANEVGVINHIAVDGITNVIRVLEEIENGKLNDIDYFEGLACTGGCVGGALVFENNYVANMRIRNIVEKIAPEDCKKRDSLPQITDEKKLALTEPIPINTIMKLDSNLSEAIKKMEQIEKLNKELPGLDCGSCGSPSCRTMAEDIVRGYADELGCVFRMKEKVASLAQQLNDIAKTFDK